MLLMTLNPFIDDILSSKPRIIAHLRGCAILYTDSSQASTSAQLNNVNAVSNACCHR